MKSYNEITECRLCSSDKLTLRFDFGDTALANSYRTKADLQLAEGVYPLVVVQCEGCGCVQLRHSVNPHTLFDNYLYESSTSGVLRGHFEKYAKDVVAYLQLKSQAKVLEIASNDGILLKPLLDLGMDAVGVEPAKNIAKIANDKGLPTINEFFNVSTAHQINAERGKFDLIVANNCFAHIEDISSVVAGVNLLLEDDGVFVFENAYLYDTIKDGHFSQVYHEHLFYHSIYPLKKYLKRCGLRLFHVTWNNSQGGSFRAFVAKQTSKKHEERPSVDEFIHREIRLGLYNGYIYEQLTRDIDHRKSVLNELFANIKSRGQSVAVYSVPAKFTTFSKAFGITREFIDFAVEDSKLKQGLFTPGTNIPILSSEEFYKKNPDYCLIGAYNCQQEIMDKNPNYKGKWILTYPAIQIK